MSRNSSRYVVILCLALWIFVAASHVAFAQERISTDHISLLAVTEQGNVTSGSVADLHLTIMPGSGRVFLETFPLTKESTQISLRFAEQVACKTLDIDCKDKDFLFSIRAVPGIVGGPSAGSAAAVLVAAVLKNLSIRTDVGITGTINSGGIVGMVGGVREKILGAASSGMKTVLIPKGNRHAQNTTDLAEYGAGLNVSVLEVSTLQEVLEIVTGFKLPIRNDTFIPQDSYVVKMKNVAVRLCDQARRAVEQTGEDNSSRKLLDAATEAFTKEQYYSSASYCFRAGVSAFVRLQQNVSSQELDLRSKNITEQLTIFEEQLNSREIETITDLQTMMLVRERVSDAKQILTKVTGESVGYAIERLASAQEWSSFFGTKDNVHSVTVAQLSTACEEAIAQAEERYNYVTSILPDRLQGTQEEISQAYALQQDKKFIDCLYVASKAKAESAALIGLLGVAEKDLEALVQLKLRLVENALLTSQEKGVFPLIGYSYYEYAKSLWNTDRQTSVLFVEYALEFTNLDIYFPDKNTTKTNTTSTERNSNNEQYDPQYVPALAKLFIGFAAGLLVGFVIKTLARPLRTLRGKKR